MCGIFGAFGRPGTLNISEFLCQAAVVDSLRGFQSTGVCRVNTLGAASVYKRAQSGLEFAKSYPGQQAMKWEKDTVAVIGHNRAATIGSVSDANAHPFTRKHITLVHNGHISNAAAVGEKAGLQYMDWHVDSDTAAAAIAELGAKEALPGLAGAFVLVWWDSQLRTLNFAANDQRPLWFGIVKDKEKGANCILFASERGMLEWVANRNGISIKQFLRMEAQQHVAFTLDENGSWPKPVTKTFNTAPFTFPRRQYDDPGYPGSWRTDSRTLTDDIKDLVKEKAGIEDDGKDYDFSIISWESNMHSITFECESIVDPNIRARLCVSRFAREQEYLDLDKIAADACWISAKITSVSYTGGYPKRGDIGALYNENRIYCWLNANGAELLDERMASMFKLKDFNEKPAVKEEPKSEPVKLRRPAGSPPVDPLPGAILKAVTVPDRIGHAICTLRPGALVKYKGKGKNDKHLWLVEDWNGKLYELSGRRFEIASKADADLWKEVTAIECKLPTQ